MRPGRSSAHGQPKPNYAEVRNECNEWLQVQVHWCENRDSPSPGVQYKREKHCLASRSTGKLDRP
jgi:hypothetical protein